MYEEENITSDTLADESQLNSAAVDEAVSQPKAPADALSLSELNSILGKDFKDIETAKKSVKDTYSYVGKKREDIISEISGNTESLSKEVKEIKENSFYRDHPEFAEHRALIAKIGGNPEEVVSTPEFKSIFEKADGYNKLQSQRSVLVSNPRLASSKDNLSKAMEAQSTGNREAMEKHATAAVLDLLNS